MLGRYQQKSRDHVDPLCYVRDYDSKARKIRSKSLVIQDISLMIVLVPRPIYFCVVDWARE